MEKSASAPARLPANERVKEFALLALIVGAVFASFWPTLKNGFVDWDDTGMFLANYSYRGLSWENIKWMFTTTHYAHYHPLTWLTLGLDYKIWSTQPNDHEAVARGIHFTSLLIHALNAVVFYFLIKTALRIASPGQLSRWGNNLAAAAGALFFAIHPLRVESVAWATERRDVLSGFFYLLTLLAYLRANETQPRKTKWAVLAIVFFLLSFLCKAWGITLPLVLLVLDVYPLRRIEFDKNFRRPVTKLLLEKIPFIVLSLIFGYVAFRAQQTWGIKAHNFGFWARVMNSAYGLVFYPWKTFVPLDLSPIYPLDPDFNPAEAKFIFCLAAGITITVVLFILRRRWPMALCAWICYAVIVSPVLGAAQSGEQIAADRYTYLSCLPFALLVAAAIVKLFLISAEKNFRAGEKIIPVAIGTILAVFGLLTFQQTKTWHDDLALWGQALKSDPNNWVALNGRGRFLYDQGKLDDAFRDFSLAIKLNPRRVAPWTNRGMIYQMQGKYDEALADYNQSLALEWDHNTFNNRGALKEVKGDLAGAVADYSKAIQMFPKSLPSYLNRGSIRHRQGDLKGALEDFTNAIRAAPDNPSGWAKRADIRWEQGDLKGAAEDFFNALKVAGPNWSQRQSTEERLNAVLHVLKSQGVVPK